MREQSGLNPKQQEAVLHTEGPLLIIAGAGAGKTLTIAYRILELIRRGVAPHEILAITFTNKAARDMKERVEKILRQSRSLNLPIRLLERPFVGTFHSLGAHILRESGRAVGVPRNFTIFDRPDSKQTIRTALSGLGLDPKEIEPGKILSVISREKGSLTTVEIFAQRALGGGFEEVIGRVWQRYEEILREEKALDFDDLLLKTAILLEKEPEVRKHYQKIWRYIHIDEYQDTNRVQYLIVKRLAENYKNICVVGDADQNIYTWRGATIHNILNFEKDYPQTKVVLLERNYRSTKNIIEVANHIIEKNKYRRKKHLYTLNDRGERIGLYTAADENEEAAFVAEKAVELAEEGVKPREIAVLYRANFQSRAIEEAFLQRGLPYQLIGTAFFERKEVKDVLSYLRLALNPESLSDLKRVINVPPRGIGKVSLLKILEGKEDSLPRGGKEKLRQFRAFIAQIAEHIEKDKPSETMKFAVTESGLEDMFRDGSEEDRERLENLFELVSLATRYNTSPSREGVEKLLEDASLQTEQDEIYNEAEAVRLMTVHAAKGLEFDYVFITGLEEDLFPHAAVDEDGLDLEESEEERRLFYVALTRARRKIILSCASTRTIFGARQNNLPSQFLAEIDDSYLEALNRESLKKVIEFS